MQKITVICDNCGRDGREGFKFNAILRYHRKPITGEIVGHDSFFIDLCRMCTIDRFESLCANLAIYVPEDRMRSYAGLLSHDREHSKESVGCTVDSSP